MLLTLVYSIHVVSRTEERTGGAKCWSCRKAGNYARRGWMVLVVVGQVWANCLHEVFNSVTWMVVSVVAGRS